MSDVIVKAVEGTHVGFLHHLTGNMESHQVDGEWETLVVD